MHYREIWSCLNIFSAYLEDSPLIQILISVVSLSLSVILFHTHLFFFLIHNSKKFTFLIPRLSSCSNFYSLLTEDSMKYVCLNSHSIHHLYYSIHCVQLTFSLHLYLSYQCRDIRICLWYKCNSHFYFEFIFLDKFCFCSSILTWLISVYFFLTTAIKKKKQNIELHL